MANSINFLYDFFFGIGYGAIGWYALGHFATKCLFIWFRRARELHTKGVLKSTFPMWKYITCGIGAIGLGLYAGSFFWAGDGSGVDVGMVCGTLIFAVHSTTSSQEILSRGWDLHEYISFLDANRRWIDEEKTEVFSEREFGADIEGDRVPV